MNRDLNLKRKRYLSLAVLLCLVFTITSTSLASLDKVEKTKINKIKKEEYGEYTLGKMDVVDINVRRHAEFSGRFPVGPNGKIQYPFVGDIVLENLTRQEAAERLKDIITKYIESPEVDVTIVEYNSKVVYVMGAVARPGKYAMRNEFMPVREAVIAAGLPRENVASLRRAMIIRPQENGKPLVKKVNLLRLLYEGKLDINYDLRSGDIIVLPTTALYKVSTILEQIVSPFFQSSSAYNTWEQDVLYRDQPRR
ncbi:MAG: polysaccharide export protein [Candidatus Omnitrophica bacterium]|nr:polysaccharide export protein [Candidatus Omnitrophota bacterium]MBU4479168.1 polysaccharide export protein [Candidatus Omnitrophota bacterium]MCG2703982.1 polysaccharide export protein [Candidatus Omnitrophota bacterium]